MADLKTTTKLRGLALPATKGPGGYFESKDPTDVAWGDLMVALFTPRGTRVMRRSFGSVLREQLFEPADDAQAGVIDFVIREAAQEHCPHLQIRDVQVSVSSSSVMSVRVFFAIKTDTSNVIEREVLVSKSFISADRV